MVGSERSILSSNMGTEAANILPSDVEYISSASNQVGHSQFLSLRHSPKLIALLILDIKNPGNNSQAENQHEKVHQVYPPQYVFFYIVHRLFTFFVNSDYINRFCAFLNSGIFKIFGYC